MRISARRRAPRPKACGHWCRSGGGRYRLADLDPIGTRALPIVEHHAVRLDEVTDLGCAHPEHLVKDRHDYAEGVVAEDRGLGDPCQVSVLGCRDCEPIGVIDVQHDVDVRAPIAHVDDAVGSYA